MGSLTDKMIGWICSMFICTLPFMLAFGTFPRVVQLLAIILDAPGIFFKIPLTPFQTGIFTLFYGLFFALSPFEALIGYTFICITTIQVNNQKIEIVTNIWRCIASLAMFVVGIGFKCVHSSLYKVWYQPECLIIPQLICNLGIGMNITCSTCLYIFNQENNAQINNLGFGRRHVRIFNCYVYPIFVLILISLQIVEILQCYDNYLYFNCALTAYSIGNLLFDRPAASYGGSIGCGIAIMYLRSYENYVPSMATGITLGTYVYDVLVSSWSSIQYVTAVQSTLQKNKGFWLFLYIPNTLFVLISSILLSPMIQISPIVPLFIPSFMRPRYWDVNRLRRAKFSLNFRRDKYYQMETEILPIKQLLNHHNTISIRHLVQGQFWRQGDALLLIGPLEPNDYYNDQQVDPKTKNVDLRNIKTPSGGVLCLIHSQDPINSSICVSTGQIKVFGENSVKEVRTITLNGILAQQRRFSQILRQKVIKNYNIQQGIQRFGSIKPDPRFNHSSLISYAGEISLVDPKTQTLHLQNVDSQVLQRIFVQLLHEIIIQEKHWLFFLDQIPFPRGSKSDTIIQYLSLLPSHDVKIAQFVIKLCYLDQFELFNTTSQFLKHYGHEGAKVQCSLYRSLLQKAYRTLLWGVFTQRLGDPLPVLLKSATTVCLALVEEAEYKIAKRDPKISQFFRLITLDTAEVTTVRQSAFQAFRLHAKYFRNIFATAEHFRHFYGLGLADVPQLKIESALYQTLLSHAYSWEYDMEDGYIF